MATLNQTQFQQKKSKTARAEKLVVSLAGDPTPTSVERTSVGRHRPRQAKNKNRCSYWPGCMNENYVKNRHCSICNLTFKFVKSFLDHELHSHKTREIPIINLKTLCCNVCNKGFVTTYLYRIHMATLNNIRIPLIRPKPNPSKTPDANDPNNYCLSRNFIFKGRTYYRSHLVNVHHMSHLGPSRSRNPKNMKPTIDILSLYCDACMKTYDTKKSYIHHLVKFHEMIVPNVYSEPGNFDSIRLYCKVCDIMYRKKFQFISHLRRIHHTKLPSCPDLIPSINAKNNYCIACDMTLTNRNVYLQHPSSTHLEETAELYQGIDCKSSSKEDIRLKRYCADCHKVFLRKSLYHIHLDKIHGIKPLDYFLTADDSDVNIPNNHCTLCDKTFQRKEVYRLHMIRVHNMTVTKRPFINSNITPVVDFLKKYCNSCDKVYKTLQSYQSHLFKYHHINSGQTESLSKRVNRNEIPAIDEINSVYTACDKTYASKSAYKIHLYSIHGIKLPRLSRKALQINRDIIPKMNDKKKHCAPCNRTYSSRNNYKYRLAAIHDMKEKNIKQDENVKQDENIKQEDENEKLNIRSVRTN
ncbi:hypothetical protein HPULCUR_009525 [Helicostylum pulchrum]|uniref:C2H2-type domain-containing protein n=1 Tax=Helicostylum pulchrum TaxID=562976 RepID=A0ABP9YAP2_9FUNG